MTTFERKVAAGINYLKAMREGNMNVYELSEHLEVDVEIVKDCITAAREKKEQSKKGFETNIQKPRFFIGKGVKGEYQGIKQVDISFERSINLNYDVTEKSEFVVMLPVKVTVTRM